MSSLNFDAKTFIADIQGHALSAWAELLCEAVSQRGHALKHGHLSQWQAAIDSLPCGSQPGSYSIQNGSVHIACGFDTAQLEAARHALTQLSPWRKGPYHFDSIHIDTEWRSDWKWDRLAAHISCLEGRCVLDVGCGSGYHLWRMHKAGASMVLGIDPSLLYLMQFRAAQYFIQQPRVQFLPLSMESLPAPMHAFDTVFSMGVLYHRRNPLTHLNELRQAMRENGELVLETLIIPGELDQTLPINDRYANMRNVYELPSLSRLKQWLTDAGFCNYQVVSVDQTTEQEQRSTPWMTSHSLANSLNPTNSCLTIEGLPRPLRAIVTASSRPG